jgi:molecular chaperone Hsp33
LNKEQNEDKVIRAITNDGAFRVITAITTDTVRGAITAQGARGTVAKRFGELVTGAILIREAMSPTLRVQGILKGAGGKGSMVADSHPDGTNRGLVGFAGETGLGAGKGGQTGILQMMRTLPNGALHQGMVEVAFEGQENAISAALMEYMQHSEQIVSTIAVTTLMGADDRIIAAAGYIVELLPEVERGPLMIMTQRLEDFPSLDDMLKGGELSSDSLLAELLHGMPFTKVGESPLSYGCNCSELRVLSSLATLPRSDLEDLLSDGKVLEISCDYCRKDYRISPTQLRSLLTTS